MNKALSSADSELGMLTDWTYVQKDVLFSFLVAPAFLKQSDLSSHYGVCMFACLIDCLLDWLFVDSYAHY